MFLFLKWQEQKFGLFWPSFKGQHRYPLWGIQSLLHHLLHHFIRGIFVTHFELISRPDLKKTHTQEIWNCSSMETMWCMALEWGYNLKINLKAPKKWCCSLLCCCFSLLLLVSWFFEYRKGRRFNPLCLIFKEDSVILWMSWGKKSFHQSRMEKTLPFLRWLSWKIKSKSHKSQVHHLEIKI